jgi:hypothetical protein
VPLLPTPPEKTGVNSFNKIDNLSIYQDLSMEKTPPQGPFPSRFPTRSYGRRT